MLRINIKIGESVRIGDYAIITLEEKSGKSARLAIDADRSIAVTRVQPNTTAQLAASGGITGKP
jgi:sRNA-binding carbon storage regulator CsrA